MHQQRRLLTRPTVGVQLPLSSPLFLHPPLQPRLPPRFFLSLPPRHPPRSPPRFLRSSLFFGIFSVWKRVRGRGKGEGKGNPKTRGKGAVNPTTLTTTTTTTTRDTMKELALGVVLPCSQTRTGPLKVREPGKDHRKVRASGKTVRTQVRARVRVVRVGGLMAKVKVTQMETTEMEARIVTMTPMIMRTLSILKMTLVGDF